MARPLVVALLAWTAAEFHWSRPAGPWVAASAAAHAALVALLALWAAGRGPRASARRLLGAALVVLGLTMLDQWLFLSPSPPGAPPPALRPPPGPAQAQAQAQAQLQCDVCAGRTGVRVAVLLVHTDQGPEADAAVTALRAATRWPWDAVVVDNGSRRRPSGPGAALRLQSPVPRSAALSAALHYAAGLAAARGECYLGYWLWPLSAAPPAAAGDVLGALAEALAARPEAAAVHPAVSGLAPPLQDLRSVGGDEVRPVWSVGDWAPMWRAAFLDAVGVAPADEARYGSLLARANHAAALAGLELLVHPGAVVERVASPPEPSEAPPPPPPTLAWPLSLPCLRQLKAGWTPVTASGRDLATRVPIGEPMERQAALEVAVVEVGADLGVVGVPGLRGPTREAALALGVAAAPRSADVVVLLAAGASAAATQLPRGLLEAALGPGGRFDAVAAPVHGAEAAPVAGLLVGGRHLCVGHAREAARADGEWVSDLDALAWGFLALRRDAARAVPLRAGETPAQWVGRARAAGLRLGFTAAASVAAAPVDVERATAGVVVYGAREECPWDGEELRLRSVAGGAGGASDGVVLVGFPPGAAGVDVTVACGGGGLAGADVLLPVCDEGAALDAAFALDARPFALVVGPGEEPPPPATLRRMAAALAGDPALEGVRLESGAAMWRQGAVGGAAAGVGGSRGAALLRF